MTKLAIALAAAGFMLAAPALTAPAAAATTMTDAIEQPIQLTPGTQLAQINVQIGPDRRGPRYRSHYRHNRPHYRHRQVCTSRVTYRQGRRVVVRTCR